MHVNTMLSPNAKSSTVTRCGTSELFNEYFYLQVHLSKMQKQKKDHDASLHAVDLSQLRIQNTQQLKAIAETNRQVVEQKTKTGKNAKVTLKLTHSYS